MDVEQPLQLQVKGSGLKEGVIISVICEKQGRKECLWFASAMLAQQISIALDMWNNGCVVMKKRTLCSMKHLHLITNNV